MCGLTLRCSWAYLYGTGVSGPTSFSCHSRATLIMYSRFARRRPYPPLHSGHSARTEGPGQRFDGLGVCGFLHTFETPRHSAVDAGASVELWRFRAEGVKRPEQAVAAERRVLGDADLDGERFAGTRCDRLRLGAVEVVHLDLAGGHELLDIRRAAVEADARPRRVLEHDDEPQYPAAPAVD